MCKGVSSSLMHVFGIAGWSGSGKTFLLRRLLPELSARALKVATMKYSHHNFDVFSADHEATAWRAAGASEVIYASDRRWTLIHEYSDQETRLNPELLFKEFGEIDLLLIEGFKKHRHAKLEIFRRDADLPVLAIEDDMVVAIASDSGRPIGLPNEREIVILDLENISAIADFIISYSQLA